MAQQQTEKRETTNDAVYCSPDMVATTWSVVCCCEVGLRDSQAYSIRNALAKGTCKCQHVTGAHKSISPMHTSGNFYTSSGKVFGMSGSPEHHRCV